MALEGWRLLWKQAHKELEEAAAAAALCDRITIQNKGTLQNSVI